MDSTAPEAFEPSPRFAPCCQGGWWLSGEMPPVDPDQQPETD